VGLTTAIIGVGFLGPALGAGFGSGSLLLLFVIGGVFGVIAGAVAGADSDDHQAPEVKAEPKAKTLRPRTGMTPAHRGV